MISGHFEGFTVVSLGICSRNLGDNSSCFGDCVGISEMFYEKSRNFVGGLFRQIREQLVK